MTTDHVLLLTVMDTSPRLLWIAVLLTAGEFGIAFYLLVTHGEAYALFYAVTYMVREKTGSNYHHILVKQFRKLRGLPLCPMSQLDTAKP